MIAGTVEIQMLADMARLREDVSTGVGLVERGAQKMQEVAGLAGKALGLIGVSLSGAAFGAWVKGAIDSADAASKLSQRAGVAVADVAGLQLAFDLGGSSAEGMATGLAKLSKNMVEGGKGFDELGVKTRNADGTMRGVKDVFYDVADAFSEIEDGAAKTAVAQQIFGKSGAELLPVLNGGAAGLREMAEMADKLGLTLSDETAKDAEKFNDTLDLVHKSTQGIATRIAAQMLPTLNSMAGALLEAATDGDTLARAADILASGLKVLFSAGVLGVEVFNTLGKTIGGVAAAVMAVAQGEFAQAKNIMAEMGSDISAGWSKSASTISKAWDDSGSKSVESLTAVAKAQRTLTLQTNEEAAASKKLADQKAAEVKKAEEDYRKLIDKIQEKTKAVEQETLKGKALTEAEKIALEIEAKYTGEKRKAALAALEKMRAAEEEKRATDLATKATEAAAAARVKEFDTIQASVVKLEEEIAAQRAANTTMLTGVDNTQQLTVAKLRAAAASADRQALVALERKEDETLYEQLKLQAIKLRELADLKEEGIHVKAAKDAADAWTKVTDQIGQGLTDSLYRAFEAGKGFFDTLWSGIVNTFKTTALKLIISGVDGKGGIVGTVMNAIGLGGGASSGASGGVGNLSSLASWASLGKSVYGWLGGGAAASGATAGSVAYSNMVGAFGGDSLGALISSNAGSWGVSTGAGASSGASAGSFSWAGPVAAIIAGMLASNTAFSQGYSQHNLPVAAQVLFPEHKLDTNILGGIIGDKWANIISGAALTSKIFQWGAGTPHRGAMYVSDGTNGYVPGANVVGDMAAGDSVYKNRSQEVEDALKTLTGGAAGLLNSFSTMFGGTGGYKVGGYWSADGHDDSLANTRIWQGDQVLTSTSRRFASDPTQGYKEFTASLASEVRKVMDTVNLPDWVEKELKGLSANASFEDIARFIAGAQAVRDTLGKLDAAFTPLGGVFAKVAGLSDDATLQLLEFAGGIEALSAKAQSYVSNYYSEKEQAAIQAAEIKRVLDAAGITADFSNRQDFRTLVDATDVQTEAGRRQLVTLLDIQQSFAGVADYLEKTGTTLDALASTAPQLALLQQTVDGQSAQVDAAQQTVEAVNTVNDSILGVQQALQAGLQLLADKLDQVVTTSAENASFIAGTAAQTQHAQP